MSAKQARDESHVESFKLCVNSNLEFMRNNLTSSRSSNNRVRVLTRDSHRISEGNSKYSRSLPISSQSAANSRLLKRTGFNKIDNFYCFVQNGFHNKAWQLVLRGVCNNVSILQGGGGYLDACDQTFIYSHHYHHHHQHHPC
jgi:hypothetical protein